MSEKIIVKMKGCQDVDWKEWFDGIEIMCEENINGRKKRRSIYSRNPELVNRFEPYSHFCKST